MKISVVVAVSDNNAIGEKGTLMWRLPKDMEHFKEITTGHHVLMGRKTWESIPEKFRPLPNRVNIIVTSQKDYKAEGAIVVSKLEEGIELAQKAGEMELMIIGGGQIYEQAFDKVQTVYLTRVHATFIDADTFYPILDEKHWKVVNQETHPADDKHKYSFDFVQMERIPQPK